MNQLNNQMGQQANSCESFNQQNVAQQQHPHQQPNQEGSLSSWFAEHQNMGHPGFRACSSPSRNITSRLSRNQVRPSARILRGSTGYGLSRCFATSQLPSFTMRSSRSSGSYPRISTSISPSSQCMIHGRFPDLATFTQKLKEEQLYKRQQSRMYSAKPSFFGESSTSAPMEKRQHDPSETSPVSAADHVAAAVLGMCTQRIIDYTIKAQERPKDNNIMFWKDFVSEFYAADASTRFCFSSDQNKSNGAYNGQQARWTCDLCLVEPGRGCGFEIGAEYLPRMFKGMYDNGAVRECYKIHRPSAYKASPNLNVLRCAQVVYEAEFQDRRVVRHGQLCAAFTSDFKICRWHFCSKRTYEFDLRGNFIQQVTNVSETTEKYRDGNQSNQLPAPRVQEISWRNENSSSSSVEAYNSSLDVLRQQIQDPVNDMTGEMQYVKQTGTSPQDAMARFAQTFSMLTVNNDSELQADDFNILNSSAAAQSLPDMFLAGQALPTNHIPFDVPSNISSSRDMELSVLHPQGSGVSSLASLAARMNIDSNQEVSSFQNNEIIELDSPSPVSEAYDNQDMNMDMDYGRDYFSSGGKDVMMTFDEPEDDFFEQLPFFVQGKST